ncbi:MAG: DUF4157 domain-containing protein [Gemmatimonadales bacterium]|nr:MAG: DUF4157 domain-containing protein [Gemmatimonadales bacterium]
MAHRRTGDNLRGAGGGSGEPEGRSRPGGRVRPRPPRGWVRHPRSHGWGRPAAELQRGMPPHPLVSLGRKIGNRTVHAMTSGDLLPTPARVGAANDPLEREADRIADRLAPGAPQTAVQRQSADGARLPDPLRNYFEQRLGSDLGAVRIHDGPAATAANRSLGSYAFARETDILFGAGRYAPHTRNGMRLLAHELAHVAQRTGGSGVREAAPRGAVQMSGPETEVATTVEVEDGETEVRTTTTARTAILEDGTLGPFQLLPSGSVRYGATIAGPTDPRARQEMLLALALFRLRWQQRTARGGRIGGGLELSGLLSATELEGAVSLAPSLRTRFDLFDYLSPPVGPGQFRFRLRGEGTYGARGGSGLLGATGGEAYRRLQGSAMAGYRLDIANVQTEIGVTLTARYHENLATGEIQQPIITGVQLRFTF